MPNYLDHELPLTQLPLPQYPNSRPTEADQLPGFMSTRLHQLPARQYPCSANHRPIQSAFTYRVQVFFRFLGRDIGFGRSVVEKKMSEVEDMRVQCVYGSKRWSVKTANFSIRNVLNYESWQIMTDEGEKWKDEARLARWWRRDEQFFTAYSLHIVAYSLLSKSLLSISIQPHYQEVSSFFNNN